MNQPIAYTYSAAANKDIWRWQRGMITRDELIYELTFTHRFYWESVMSLLRNLF